MTPRGNDHLSQGRGLRLEVQAGGQQRVLTPVGSSGGDGCYVQAHWDPEKPARHRPLPSRARVQASLAGRAEAYGRQERTALLEAHQEWALSIAGKIDACGGKASFPNRAAKK
jgi:hypothetical protein